MHNYAHAMPVRTPEPDRNAEAARARLRLTARGKGLLIACGTAAALWAGAISAAWVVLS